MEHFLSTGLTLGSVSNITTERGSEDGSIAFSSFPLFPFLLSSYYWPLTGSSPPASSSQAQGFQACTTMPSSSGQFLHSFEFYGTWRNRGLHYQLWEKARTGWGRVDSFFGLSPCTFGKEKRCSSWIFCVLWVRVLLPWLQFWCAPLWIFAHNQICVWREKEQSWQEIPLLLFAGSLPIVVCSCLQFGDPQDTQPYSYEV